MKYFVGIFRGLPTTFGRNTSLKREQCVFCYCPNEHVRVGRAHHYANRFPESTGFMCREARLGLFIFGETT